MRDIVIAILIAKAIWALITRFARFLKIWIPQLKIGGYSLGSAVSGKLCLWRDEEVRHMATVYKTPKKVLALLPKFLNPFL